MKTIKILYFLITYFFISHVYAIDDYIPSRAYIYKNTIINELNNNFSDLYNYNYIPSLIEHESCISLKSKKCWSSLSSLKTSREEGAGLLQITKTYNDDGSIRFDKLTELRNQYKDQLKEAKWETIYLRPDIQIRMGILMIRDDYNKLYKIENKEERLKMVDAAYNGGFGGLQKERRACGMSSKCNPDIWTSNVELFCLKSKKALYGTRSACDINRHHVYDVFVNKLPKYTMLYITEK